MFVKTSQLMLEMVSNEQIKRPPAKTDLLKVNNRNSRKRCEIC